MNRDYIILSLTAFPFVIQALALAFDEFVFHRRRGLPRWECAGHPLDTVSVIVPLALVVFMPFAEPALFLFVFLALFSCFFVTKDEWVHARECDPAEHWLHSVLFICHPLVFVATAILWIWRDAPQTLKLDAGRVPDVAVALNIQFMILIIFFLYQIIYWNIARRSAFDSAARLKLPETKSEFADPQSCVSATE
jgi:cbb3-type cytochrome oxidase subunit 3